MISRSVTWLYISVWGYDILRLISCGVVTVRNFGMVAPAIQKVGSRANNHDDARPDRSHGASSHSTHKKSGGVVAQHDFPLGETEQDPGTGRREEWGQMRNLSSGDIPCTDTYEDIFRRSNGALQ